MPKMLPNGTYTNGLPTSSILDKSSNPPIIQHDIPNTITNNAPHHGIGDRFIGIGLLHILSPQDGHSVASGGIRQSHTLQ
jgi:hypothetical protein